MWLHLPWYNRQTDRLTESDSFVLHTCLDPRMWYFKTHLDTIRNVVALSQIAFPFSQMKKKSPLYFFDSLRFLFFAISDKRFCGKFLRRVWLKIRSASKNTLNKWPKNDDYQREKKILILFAQTHFFPHNIRPNDDRLSFFNISLKVFPRRVSTHIQGVSGNVGW